MSPFLRKAVVVIALALGALELTSLPASASVDSMKVQVCNDTGKYQSRVYISGTNQDNKSATTPDFDLHSNNCFTYQFQGTYWWWAVGSYVYVGYPNNVYSCPGGGCNTAQVKLVSGRNGGVFTVRLTDR